MSIIGVFGATGNIGQHVLSLLISEPTVREIRILTNRPERIGENVLANAKKDGTKLNIVKGNYCCFEGDNKDIVHQTLNGCKRLFVVLPQSLSSGEMIRAGNFVSDCAVRASVECIVRISSLGIDDQSMHYVVGESGNELSSPQGPLGDAHVAIEAHCRAIGLNQVSLRPTSLFSNIGFNRDELLTKSTISMPLGTTARVNWVSCEDVARVATKVLVAKEWNGFGMTIDITGPGENTLGAIEMAKLLSKSVINKSNKQIEYIETNVPPVPDYAGLWKFLRKGGYDCHCDAVERITGQQGQKFAELQIVE